MKCLPLPPFSLSPIPLFSSPPLYPFSLLPTAPTSLLYLSPLLEQPLMLNFEMLNTTLKEGNGLSIFNDQ